MPKITHPAVVGTAEVSERTAPFWLRHGWQLVDEPTDSDQPEDAPLPADEAGPKAEDPSEVGDLDDTDSSLSDPDGV